MSESAQEELEMSSQEQAADLAELQSMAGEGVAVAGQDSAQPVPVDLAGELGGLVTAAVSMLAPMFPSLPGIYTPEATQAAANAVAGVCHKHGWMQDGLGGRYGEEIACAFIVGPLAFATFKGVQADIAARTPAGEPGMIAFDKAPQGVALGNPGAKTVTMGVAA